MSRPTEGVIAELRAARQLQGLTQAELAQRLGRRTYQMVFIWEKGGNITLANLQDWAAALGKRLVLEDIMNPGDDDDEPQ